MPDIFAHVFKNKVPALSTPKSNGPHDGAKTSLNQKGDRVKNLFAIALLQFVAKQDPGDQLILEIEEPEAHLHSEAIYKLKPKFRQLSDNHVVLLTTHSPT